MLGDEMRYKLMRLLEANPGMSQRDAALELGIGTVYQHSTLIPARVARSELRSPGERRRPRSGIPNDSGWMLSRLARTKAPSGVPMTQV